MSTPSPVYFCIEQCTIPTYPTPLRKDNPIPEEEMPMFAETSNHQGTTGNPYPMRVVSEADADPAHRLDCEWTVIRLENDYIRLAILPELGGRIFEAYDKTTGYDFLYRQHVIKPALIGAYGSWISGGVEFNWPFHHRPSTILPADYTIEEEPDGSVIVWLSEHAPNDRTKGMVGIVLRPDRSYFETRVVLSNRTPHRHNFLWWENAAVAVHEDYRLVIPPDVTWVHHHNDAGHTTFPIAQGQYGADNITEPKDISWHKNSKLATSYFAAPSKYDFFGGYDYRKNCGILHIGDHHVSPGKKMFTWGYGSNADNWEKKLTDSDGPYAELMAGSYTDDQPDFTWIAPYETKAFSQFWYPTQGIGYTSYATLDAAVSLDRENKVIRVNVTAAHESVTLTVRSSSGTKILGTCAMTPSAVAEYPYDFPENEKLSVALTDENGTVLLRYTEEDHDYIHIPADNKGTPLPDQLATPMQLVTAGQHIDQYRHPLYKPDLYYLEALRRDADFLPALKSLGEFYARSFRYDDALTYLDRAWAIECRYNQNPEDGTVNYLRGVCLKYLGKPAEAYDAFRRAAWSNNVISPAMTQASAIAFGNGDYTAAYQHACAALEKEARNPVACVYAALAQWKLGDTRHAADRLRGTLALDPLNHLARYALCIVTGRGKAGFYTELHSNPAQTVLDLTGDLWTLGLWEDIVSLLRGALKLNPTHAMLRYTLAAALYEQGDPRTASRELLRASKAERIVDVFPFRAEEIDVLRFALGANPKDGFAAYLLGCALYHARKYEEAAELWETAIKYIPDFYIPYRNLALAYFNHLGREDDALPLMRRAVELHPNDGTLLTEAATVMQKLGTSAAENAAFLNEYKPDNVTDQIQLTIARAYNAAGQYDLAEQAMRSHTFSPGEGAEFTTAEPYMTACFQRGCLAMKEGRYEDALNAFLASQKMPENLNVGFWNESVMMPYLYYEAAARKALGQTEEAEKIIERLAGMKNVGMWNMGGEFLYYYAMAVRLGGNEMRAQKIMRDAILAWERELAGGCTYHRVGGGIYNCFIGDGPTARLATLHGMLGYGKLYNGDIAGAAEEFRKSLELSPSAKIAFELKLLED